MKPIFLFAALGLCVSGCSFEPMYVRYKDGVSRAQLQSALVDCKVEAANKVPANTQLVSVPGVSTPLKTNCSAIGNTASCTSTGGQTFGPTTFSIDENHALRVQVADQCMARRGWKSALMPFCPSHVSSKVRGNPEMLPETIYVDQSSCLIFMGDLNHQIYTPPA